jgi:hypothetical protein
MTTSIPSLIVGCGSGGIRSKTASPFTGQRSHSEMRRIGWRRRVTLVARGAGSGGGRDASSSSSRLSTSSRASSSLSRTFLMRLALICTYNPPADCFNLSLHAPSRRAMMRTPLIALPSPKMFPSGHIFLTFRQLQSHIPTREHSDNGRKPGHN